jgi:hypothetical protein
MDVCGVGSCQSLQNKCLYYPGLHVGLADTCQKTLQPRYLAVSSQITHALILQGKVISVLVALF